MKTGKYDYKRFYHVFDIENGKPMWSFGAYFYIGDVQHEVETVRPSPNDERRDVVLLNSETGDLVERLGELTWLEIEDETFNLQWGNKDKRYTLVHVLGDPTMEISAEAI